MTAAAMSPSTRGPGLATKWNDTIITADAYQIPQDHPLLEAVRAAFLQKNRGKWASSATRRWRAIT
jgi:hypothetical protein